MEKQEPPAYGDVGNSQSGPSFVPGETNQPPEYVPPAQQPYPAGQPAAYPAGQPGYPPGQPGYPPGQPGYPPGQPGYPPGQPGYPAGQPGYPAGQPGYPAGVQPVGVYTVNPPGATVIVRQPGAMPNDYLVFAIFVTFCCCLPCGIVAIMKASETKNRWFAGDTEGAVRSSQEAKKWAMIGLISGIVTDVCVGGFIIVYYAFIFSSFYY